MKIELIYEGFTTELDDEKDTVVRKNDNMFHKRYECNILDRDMVESPKEKKLDRFIIDNMQLTQKRDVDLAIEMLENVKEALDR